MDEDKLFNMSDEELEAEFSRAKEDDGLQDEIVEEEIEEEAPEEEELDTEDEEDLDEDLEQPLEDSDDDLDAEETEEEDDLEDSEDEEGEPDEELEAEDEQTEDEIDAEVDEVSEVQKQVFRANGREYEFTPDEIMEQFPRIFGQAMDYTKKTQAMKPWRKTIDALESAQLQHDDINLMIDVLKGDKGALSEVIKRTGVDALDLDTDETNYKPNDYGRDGTALDIKDIIDDISADKEYDTTHKILSKEWDENSFGEMTKNPEMIRLLHNDVKSGMFDKVQPIAEKLKVFDGNKKSDLDYYKDAAREYFTQQAEGDRRQQAAEQARLEKEARVAKQAELERVKASQTKQKTVKTEAKKRKAAAPTRKAAGTKKVVDYLDDSDEAFDEWYAKLQDQ